MCYSTLVFAQCMDINRRVTMYIYAKRDRGRIIKVHMPKNATLAECEFVGTALRRLSRAAKTEVKNAGNHYVVCVTVLTGSNDSNELGEFYKNFSKTLCREAATALVAKRRKTPNREVTRAEQRRARQLLGLS